MITLLKIVVRNHQIMSILTFMTIIIVINWEKRQLLFQLLIFIVD